MASLLLKIDRAKNSKSGKKLKNGRMKLEKSIEEKIEQLNLEKRIIQSDLEKMNKKLTVLQNSIQNQQTYRLKEEWLKDINESIRDKKERLECPVCFERCSPPIYICCNDHLICNICIENVKKFQNICPKCRVAYNNPKQRSRIAEEILFRELGRLEKKREDVFLYE